MAHEYGCCHVKLYQAVLMSPKKKIDPKKGGQSRLFLYFGKNVVFRGLSQLFTNQLSSDSQQRLDHLQPPFPGCDLFRFRFFAGHLNVFES